MVVLGALLVVVVAGVAVDAWFQNDGDQTVVLFGAHISNATPGRVFVAGLVAGVLLLAGIQMLRRGAARSRRRRQEQKAVIAERAAATEQVAKERDALADELARERASRPSADAEVPTHVGSDAEVELPSPTRSRHARR